ncbi:MAG: NAD(P)-binding protein, partial [Rhizobacter sp.]|nr:NAD(P)-binding protein [Rhizobacter sp.]
MKLRRRSLLGATAMAPLVGCGRGDAPRFGGGWVGAQHERGHRLRDAAASPFSAAGSVHRRTEVVIVGAGIAGLAAARALRMAGVEDLQLFDLEDEPGGNSRGHQLGGMACPLGAHYLPVPGDEAVEVIALLEELGLRQTRDGKVM